MIERKREKPVIENNNRLILTGIAAIFLFVVVGLSLSSCFPPRASSPASAQKRQAQAIADREEELQFRDETGEMDWRARVDAAEELLEQAQSCERWGQSQEALEQALDAARLMPPPGKDFDLQDQLARGDEATGGQSDDPVAEAENDDASGERKVTNVEVRKMRKALEALFERLEGSVGLSGGELSLEKDLIEIQ